MEIIKRNIFSGFLKLFSGLLFSLQLLNNLPTVYETLIHRLQLQLHLINKNSELKPLSSYAHTKLEKYSNEQRKRKKEKQRNEKKVKVFFVRFYSSYQKWCLNCWMHFMVKSVQCNKSDYLLYYTNNTHTQHLYANFQRFTYFVFLLFFARDDDATEFNNCHLNEIEREKYLKWVFLHTSWFSLFTCQFFFTSLFIICATNYTYM